MQTKISQTLVGARPCLVARSHVLNGLWLLALLLASVYGTRFTRGAQQVEIYGLSLRFHSSTAVQGGLIWRLDLTSGPQNVAANGELALAEGENEYTHSGFIFLFDPVSSRTNYLSMSLNIPTADNDGNGIFDVLEQQQAASGQTSGAYTGSDGTIHSVRAIWNKAAGTNVGVCTIEFPDLGVTFEAVFENNHYSGTYDYSKTGSRLSGPLEANRNGAAQTTLTGDLNLRIVSPSLLAWGFGELQTDTSAPVAYEGSDLDRSAPFEYSALFVMDDGDLTTAIPDYQIWLLVLPNIPDANNNGTPDLIEGGAAEDGPALALTLTGDALILTVTGGRGRTFDLETKSSVSTTEAWTKVGTYTFTTDSETIPLVLSGVGNAFYRLKQ